MDVLSWPSVCDQVSCDQSPVPFCEGGFQLTLTNPGECKPVFTCGKASVDEEGVCGGATLSWPGLGKASCIVIS